MDTHTHTWASSITEKRCSEEEPVINLHVHLIWPLKKIWMTDSAHVCLFSGFPIMQTDLTYINFFFYFLSSFKHQTEYTQKWELEAVCATILLPAHSDLCMSLWIILKWMFSQDITKKGTRNSTGFYLQLPKRSYPNYNSRQKKRQKFQAKK